MSNKITYGPHIFCGGPLWYILSNKGASEIESHNDIILSFADAFDSSNESSLLRQLKSQNKVKEGDEVNLAFMNHGATELVYLVKVCDEPKYALLINQPKTDKNIVKKEFENLTHFFKKDSRFIVEPHVFYENPLFSMYLTSYVDNALCVANSPDDDLQLGVYNPLPSYHFENFDVNTTDFVNISRIAHLINSYDKRNNIGISKTQISGNDFMLKQETNLDSLQSIIDNTVLIAVRDTINVSFDEYVALIRKEFQVGTYRNSKLGSDFKINHHSKMPINSEIIDEGIEQGLLLRTRNY
jgi:hypothetical protein